MSTLRDEQRRLVRGRILEALAGEIVDHGLLDFSMQSVAERAGVSPRTVYNHFDNKETLVASLGELAEERMEQMGGRLVEPDLARMPEAVRVNFRIFAEMGTVATALTALQASAQLSVADEATTRLQARRTEALRSALGGLRPDLDDDRLEAVTAIMRMLASFSTYYRLTADHGLDGEMAGVVTAWAFSVLTAELERGGDPFH